MKKIKRIFDSLAAVLSPVDEEDLIIHTLNGLTSDYVGFMTSIRTRSSPLSIKELHVLLLCEELSIESSQSTISEYSTIPFAAFKDPTKFGNGGPSRNYNKSTGRGRNSNNRGRYNRGRGFSLSSNRSTDQFSYPKQCCQICNRTGHSALDCYHRMDYSFQGRHPPAKLAAMVASFNSRSDSTWYADSGATNHITNDLNKRSVHSDYQGKDHVSIGNDRGLTIAHTGSSLVHTSPSLSSLKLTNILHVPSIASNLLSVHRFTTDND